MQRLREVGAEAFVGSAFEDPRHWGFITSRIETGRGEWLALAKAMIPAADGASAEELQSSLATALVAKPSNVLRLLQSLGGKPPWVESVCDAPFHSPGKTWLIKYKAKALMAVQSVREPQLARQKARCLRALRLRNTSMPPEFYE